MVSKERNSRLLTLRLTNTLYKGHQDSDSLPYGGSNWCDRFLLDQLESYFDPFQDF